MDRQKRGESWQWQWLPPPHDSGMWFDNEKLVETDMVSTSQILTISLPHFSF
jgi:hypothetical protein